MKETTVYEDDFLKIDFSKYKNDSHPNFYTLYIPKKVAFGQGFYPISEEDFDDLAKLNGDLEAKLNEFNSQICSSLKEQKISIYKFKDILKKAYDKKKEITD